MIREDDELQLTAVDELKALGLSEYAAKTLVTLTELGRATARDVSESSSVPRTRVYDAVEELSERGLVAVDEGEPKVFEVATPARIRRRFYREYVFRLAIAVWSLQGIADAEDGRDVATTTDPREIDRRIREAVDHASRQVTLIPNETDLDRDLVDSLHDAVDRGVTVRIVAVADVDPAVLRQTVPGGSVVEVTGPNTPECTRTRLVIADEELAHLGITSPDDPAEWELGLFSERPGTDVATMLSLLVETCVVGDADEE